MIVSLCTAKTGRLELDRVAVGREVGFYALAIALIYYALHDVETVEGSDGTTKNIFISFTDSCILFGGYILYVIVCINMKSISKLFASKHDEEEMLRMNSEQSYGSCASREKKVRG